MLYLRFITAVTSDRIKSFVVKEKLATPTAKSHDSMDVSSDDDEGEILSDDEVGGVSQKMPGHRSGIR